LDPEQLGSPWGAALSSLFTFSVGAAIPLVPFLFGAGVGPMVVAVVASGVALFVVGAALSRFTGRSLVWSGGRMLVVGAIAGAVTYGVGDLLHVATT
jgi:VIT1/CCC1 family predicted Fe2+/Mn2+ transporter